MKKTTKLKAFALSVAMVFGMLLPNAAFAQSDDFFRSEDNFNGNRFAADWAISNNGIGQSEAPVGSGLLILGAIGAGYAIARRKRSRKGVTMILALAMMLGFTQCGKKVVEPTVNNDKVHITLRMADGGSKVNVYPTGGGTYATVDFEVGDKIYIGNGGKYVGCLELKDGGSWEGDLDEGLSTDDYLHLYFLGNQSPLTTITEGKTTSFAISIADQRNEYPVISYNHTNEKYNGVGEYTATKLFNKCAIMKFTTTNISKVITITGMNNTVTVDFSANNGATTGDPYTFSKSNNGRIRLHAETNTERWAILLPQEEVTTATAYAEGYTTNAAFTVETVSANGYYNSGKNIELSPGSNVPGAFTINSYGDQVFFAPGNLQYQASTNTWRFAEHQWDYVGDASKGNVYVGEVKSSNTLISSSYEGWIDLFGWGTGDNPIKGIDGSYNSTFNDWGGYCGDPTGNSYTWRTLTEEEWQYILDHSTKGWSTVADVKGYVLRPDGNATVVASSYTAYEWAAEEASGSVFLPAAGDRIGTGVYGVGSYDYYWSSTASGDPNAWYVNFNEGGANMNSYLRDYGYSVRLVR